MPDHRHTEVHVLGYRIQRVRTLDERGMLAAQRYEVLAPESDVLLGTFAQRADAEREIVSRELGALPRRPA